MPIHSDKYSLQHTIYPHNSPPVIDIATDYSVNRDHITTLKQGWGNFDEIFVIVSTGSCPRAT